MRLIRDTQSKVYAAQFGRLVVYIDRPLYAPTWHGGIVVTMGDRRVLARHVAWRLCWVP